MKPTGDLEAWLGAWQRLGEGFLTPTGAAAAEATAAFTRFAEGFAGLSRPAAGPGAPEEWQRFTTELRGLAERFVTGSFPAWPAPPGAGPEWAGALEGWSRILTGIATDTANRFAAALATRPPATLRASFDRWIDCAEAAYQAAAHGDAFLAAQARLVNVFVVQRRRQQELLERTARALGLPTRAEVDALHDALRALRDAPAPAAASRPRPPTRKSAPRATRAPATKRRRP